MTQQHGLPFIEFFGAAGSGKSTLYRHLIGAARQSVCEGQVACYRALQGSGRGLGRVKALLGSHRTAASRSGDRKLLNTFGITPDCVELCNFVFEQFRVDPAVPQKYFDRISAFQGVVAHHSALQHARDTGNRPALFDEHFAQKCLAMSLHAPEPAAFIAGFVEHMPRAALYIGVETPFETAQARIRSRGHGAAAQRENHLAYDNWRILRDTLLARGLPVVCLDGTRPVAENSARLLHQPPLLPHAAAKLLPGA